MYLTTRAIGWEERASLERQALRDGGGAVVSFAGVVWPDRRSDGRRVVALSYEAYEPMAEARLHLLAESARARWAVDAVHIRHRLGAVPVGELSVLIVVAGQHRAEAYAASRFVIEQIKHDVPIWTRAHYDDGSTEWAACAATVDADGADAGAAEAHEPNDLRRRAGQSSPARCLVAGRATRSADAHV
jgi:molybdopterin synthase catalytic subunit